MFHGGDELRSEIIEFQVIAIQTYILVLIYNLEPKQRSLEVS